MGTLRAMIVTFIRQFARALTLVAVALLILLKSVELTAIAGGVAFDTSASAVQVALWVAVCAIVWLCGIDTYTIPKDMSRFWRK